MPFFDLKAVQAMTAFTCRRPGGNLDLADVDAVEGALADAKDVVSIAIGGAKFGQADQVPPLCAHAASCPVKAIQHLQSRWVTNVACQLWRRAPLPFWFCSHAACSRCSSIVASTSLCVLTIW